MRVSGYLAVIGACLAALLVQTAALPALGLPEGIPVVLATIAVLGNALGPERGAIIGFCAGLVADVAMAGTSVLGRGALVGCLVGFLAGRLVVDRSRWSGWARLTLLVVAAALVLEAMDAFLGSWQPDPSGLLRMMAVSVLGACAVTAALLPARPALRRVLP